MFNNKKDKTTKERKRFYFSKIRVYERIIARLEKEIENDYKITEDLLGMPWEEYKENVIGSADDLSADSSVDEDEIEEEDFCEDEDEEECSCEECHTESSCSGHCGSCSGHCSHCNHDDDDEEDDDDDNYDCLTCKYNGDGENCNCPYDEPDCEHCTDFECNCNANSYYSCMGCINCGNKCPHEKDILKGSKCTCDEKCSEGLCKMCSCPRMVEYHANDDIDEDDYPCDVCDIVDCKCNPNYYFNLYNKKIEANIAGTDDSDIDKVADEIAEEIIEEVNSKVTETVNKKSSAPAPKKVVVKANTKFIRDDNIKTVIEGFNATETFTELKDMLDVLGLDIKCDDEVKEDMIHGFVRKNGFYGAFNSNVKTDKIDQLVLSTRMIMSPHISDKTYMTIISELGLKYVNSRLYATDLGKSIFCKKNNGEIYAVCMSIESSMLTLTILTNLED